MISLTDDSGRQKTLSNPDLGAVTTIEGPAEVFPTRENIRIVPSRRAWTAYTGNQRVDVGDYWSNRFASDDADNLLVSRLAAFSNEDKAGYNRLLKELLPQLNSWRIELSRGQTFIQYETESGAKHAADLFGEGMISLFRVALSLYDSRPGQLVIVDEPELSLHPQAQKILASVFSRYSSDRQIVITTHSPYFVNWSDLAGGAQIVRLTLERDGISVGTLRQVTITELKGLVGDWQKLHLLDAVSKEVFFADGVAFFEGQEDVALIQRFSSERRLPPVETFGYGAGGFGNIQLFLKMAMDLDIMAAGIFDGDHAETKALVEADFPEAMIELLPTPDIRDKFVKNNQGRETNQIEKVGIFDRHGGIKPEYEPYLRDLLQRLRFFLHE